MVQKIKPVPASPIASKIEIATQTPVVLKEPNHKITKSTRSGLIFPVARIQNNIKKGRIADKVSLNGSVFMSAVLEYLTAEVLETAGDKCLERNKGKRRMIQPRDICLAIKDDDELNQVVSKDAVIPGGGVIPYIREEMKNKKKLKKNKAQEVVTCEA
ncbi:unnamed protein product [Blepharisma stoltei]|uniref:Histone H2A n=1 Tax=Blepharisma stoltei TaxID=1481888 RepID=A0AAU9JK06_9CILI|nr:unnamed protein product [Blepharisma stoltei]